MIFDYPRPNPAQSLEIENPLIDNSFNGPEYSFLTHLNRFLSHSQLPITMIELSDVKFAQKEAVLMNTFFLLCSIGKVSLVILILLRTEEHCYGPLFLWIILMFIHDLINVLALLRLNFELLRLDHNEYLTRVNNAWNLDDSYQNIDITLHSYIRQRVHTSRYTGFDMNQNMEKTFKCLGIFMELCRLLYFVLFVYGNVVFFSDTICTLEKTPYYWAASMIFLFMGYIYLAIPLIIFSVFCFCLPFILLFFLCVTGRRRVEQDRQRELFSNFIKTLKPKLFVTDEEKEKNNECCICMQEYLESDEIIELPCNKKHNFHADCVRTWLSVNGVCPICRKNFVQEPRMRGDY